MSDDLVVVTGGSRGIGAAVCRMAAASKAAVETMTMGLAKEVSTEGVRVNTVAPGMVETDLHAAAGEPNRPQRIAPTIPMGRPGQPVEIAEGVVWLLSPAASYVTGAVLDISGGR